MYPVTRFDIDDQSDINLPETPETDTLDRPIFMAGITSDKGPEDWKTVMGKVFFKLYGSSPSFAKHGQPLLQAANCINAGGKVFAKRVVAEDATLANIGVVAKVSKIAVQKTNSDGLPLYYETDGVTETTVPDGNTPIMIQRCKIAYELKTVAIAGNDVASMAATFLAENAHTNAVGVDGHYPLFLIADNGRGVSKKKFRITPDYNANRPVDYTKYIFEVLESNEVLETMNFSMNPNIIEKDKNISLQNVIREQSIQVRGRIFEDEINAFIENVCYLIGDADQEYAMGDILNGCDVRGNAISGIIVDTTVDLSNIYGTALVGGSNGLFGDCPIKAATYPYEMVKVYNGQAGDEIYDLDNSRIDFVADANLPAVVKRAIEGLVTFREDCMYMRDMGLNLRSIEEIKLANENNLKNRFCMTYHNSWDVIDPYSKKQITVTSMYSVVPRLVNHFLNGRTRPFAGDLYEVTFPTVVEGTVNFIPKHTPAVNQKQILDDLRINYASYYSGLLTMETEYTSQEKYTQLSFGNNMLAIQELIKAIRVRCPKIRYNFIDGEDLKRYKDDVQEVINKFTHNFQSITLEYAEDTVYASNKIFYAVIKVKFRNFVQSERFKVIALAS